MQTRIDRVNRFLVSHGSKPLASTGKPFSAVWYLQIVRLAKIKLKATVDMCSEVPLDDTALFTGYAYILNRQTVRYQFVLARAYAAFSREAFGIKRPHWYEKEK